MCREPPFTMYCTFLLTPILCHYPSAAIHNLHQLSYTLRLLKQTQDPSILLSFPNNISLDFDGARIGFQPLLCCSFLEDCLIHSLSGQFLKLYPGRRFLLFHRPVCKMPQALQISFGVRSEARLDSKPRTGVFCVLDRIFVNK